MSICLQQSFHHGLSYSSDACFNTKETKLIQEHYQNNTEIPKVIKILQRKNNIRSACPNSSNLRTLTQSIALFYTSVSATVSLAL